METFETFREQVQVVGAPDEPPKRAFRRTGTFEDLVQYNDGFQEKV